jgi:hypothetical protein
MARVSYIDLTPPEAAEFYKNITPQSRFINSRVSKKNVFISRKSAKGLSQRSLLPTVAAAWNAFSDAEKLAWSDAGAVVNLNGYRLFTQDHCARIIAGLAGVATPSLLHQSRIGQIHIEAPATSMSMIQLHPHNYYVLHKVPKTKSMYEPVIVTEDIALPLEIGLNYKADLVAEGADPYAVMYAKVWHSYQGIDRYTFLELDLDLLSVWKSASATLSAVLGHVIAYELYFELNDVRGDLYFDNLVAEHSAQNWARDPFCKDINTLFTKQFFQIPKHWAAVDLPDGSWFESNYLDI